MKKETLLLKAVRDLDSAKVQKLLTSGSKKGKDETLAWQTTSSEQKPIVELKHINVNVVEEETGCTPLLLAVLHGSREIAEKLMFYSADIKAKDNQGNTALHLAIFRGSFELMEILLRSGVEVNAQNKDGNTVLHIACQASFDQRVDVITRLIREGVNVWTKNKYNLTALDVAAQFDSRDAILALLECAPTLKDNRTAIIEAAIRGFQNSVELLLEFGADCNNLDDNYGSSALHEAVRFSRFNLVQLLLDFQADPDLLNLKHETPRSLAQELSPLARGKMNNIFEESQGRSVRRPRLIKDTDSPPELLQSFEPGLQPAFKRYPELPNEATWTQNHPVYCSSCTEKNPNTHILDDNLSTFWVVPVRHNAWTILDLHSDHLITGITVYGWNNPRMLKTFQLQTSDSLGGPWTVATSHTCQLVGSSDIRTPAFPQDFHGFTFRSRYIRLYLVDNHQGKCICFQGIRLHGVDCRVIETLNKCGLMATLDTFLSKRINTWKKFLGMTREMVDSLVTDSDKGTLLCKEIVQDRKLVCQMKTLIWLTPPPIVVTAGDILPSFSVQSDVGVTETVQLLAQGADISGTVFKQMTSTDEGRTPAAIFSDIIIHTSGVWFLTVAGITSGVTAVAPTATEVKPKVKSAEDIAAEFDQIQQMLKEL